MSKNWQTNDKKVRKPKTYRQKRGKIVKISTKISKNREEIRKTEENVEKYDKNFRKLSNTAKKCLKKIKNVE